MVRVGRVHVLDLGFARVLHQDSGTASGINGVMWGCNGLLRLDDRTVHLVPV